VVFALYFVVFVAVAVATAMGWLLVAERADDPGMSASDFLVRWVPAAGLLAVAALILREASHVRRSADELRRLHRQVSGLSSYLEPLPPDARHLLHAVMLQRLFPRLVDDDPLREEPDWFPDDDELLASINPALWERINAANSGEDEPEDTDDEPNEEEENDSDERDKPVENDDVLSGPDGAAIAVAVATAQPEVDRPAKKARK
jgi:hypothetical protein